MDRTISVVGSAVASIEPDVARTNCGVQVSGPHAQDVLARSNDAMHRIIDAALDAGVARGDLRTGGPRLHPADTGYSGSNDLAITVRDIASLGTVIDAVVAAGGPSVTMHGVSFAISDPGAYLPELRREAMDAAHAIASQLAAAGGATVGEVITIDESSGYQSPRHAAPMAAGRMMTATPVEAGDQQLRIDVNVTYALVDPTE